LERNPANRVGDHPVDIFCPCHATAKTKEIAMSVSLIIGLIVPMLVVLVAIIVAIQKKRPK
jgi:hypothetical protein